MANHPGPKATPTPSTGAIASPAEAVASLGDVLRRLEAARDAVVRLEARLAALADTATPDRAQAAPSRPLTGQGATPQQDLPSVPDEAPANAANSDAIAALVGRLLAVALALPNASGAELEAGFGRFLSLVHTSRKGTPILDDGLRRYSFHQLIRNAPIYLSDATDPTSFAVARTIPADLASASDEASVFVAASTRMPTPVRLRRDPAAGNRWRIESSSL